MLGVNGPINLDGYRKVVITYKQTLNVAQCCVISWCRNSVGWCKNVFCDFAGNRVIDDTEGYVAGIRRVLKKDGTTEEVDEVLNKEGTTEEVDEVSKKEEADDDHHHDDKDDDKGSQKVMKQKSGTG